MVAYQFQFLQISQMRVKAALTLHLFQLYGDYTSGCLLVGPSLATQILLVPKIRKDFLCW